MGYSCRVDASNMLGVIRHLVGDKESSNVLLMNGERYFYEIGREHTDGAITGKVLWMVGENMAHVAGNFKISPDGEIIRFPGLSKTKKEECTNFFNDLNARNPMLLRSLGYGGI